eukprot:jgi/Ulvmu1/6137/UM027_0115.1
MTRACEVRSCTRSQHAPEPSDRVPTPQAPDAVELSPDAQSQAYVRSQQHNSYGFISSWIAQHASPCAISHSTAALPLHHHRSVSHPQPADTIHHLHAHGLTSRLDSGPSADVDGLSDAVPYHPLPPPSVSSANSAQGEPSSQCSINSMHSYPSHQQPKSRQFQSISRPRISQQHSFPHSPSQARAAPVSAPAGHHAGFIYHSQHSSKHSAPWHSSRPRSYSGSQFSPNGVPHASGAKSNAPSWRTGCQGQPPPAPPPQHARQLRYEARHLSSPPCLPQPPPPALPEAYAVPHRHSDLQRTVHYSHPNHRSQSSHDHAPGPPPLPEATVMSAWGHRPPPPRNWQLSARMAPPPPPPAASAGLQSASQPSSLPASPHPDPLMPPVRDGPPPVPQAMPQTPPHERPHSDLERFLQAVNRLWAAPPPPPPAADCSSSLQRAASGMPDLLESSAAQILRPASDPPSPSGRGCLHRTCNPIDHSNGSEGNDTLDSGTPEVSGQPAPATLADVWGRVQDCSAFGLEVICAAKGSVSCSYFVPHLSALHIVATTAPDDSHGGLDTLFDDGASTVPPEALRSVRMHDEGADEAATDGTAEDSGADAHTHSGDAETDPSPVAGAMFMDSSGFLHSGAPSTSRGSVMHDAYCHTDASNTERCPSRIDLTDLPAVFSSRVDDPAAAASPRTIAQPAPKATLRLLANWAAEGPTWERPPMFLHVQDLCGISASAPAKGGTGGQTPPFQPSSAGAQPARTAGLHACPASHAPLRYRQLRCATSTRRPGLPSCGTRSAEFPTLTCARASSRTTKSGALASSSSRRSTALAAR